MPQTANPSILLNTGGPFNTKETEKQK